MSTQPKAQQIEFVPGGGLVATNLQDAVTESATFIPAGTGAVARDMQSKLRETVCVKDFGAKGDWNGTTGTDDTVAFSKAISFLGDIGGGTLLIPPGKYKGRLNINRSNIKVVGYGAEIGYISDVTLSVEPKLGASNLAPFLGFTGTTPNNVAPGATFYNIDSTSKGSIDVNLSSTTDIVAGDYLVIISQEVTTGSTTTTNFIPFFHQIVQVKSVSGSTIKIDEPIERTIVGTDAYSYAIKWDITQNVSIEGLTVNNEYGAAYCVYFGGAVNLSLRDVTFNPSSAWGAFATCRKVTFDNCTINDAYTGFSNGRMCDDIVVNNCTVKCTDTAISTSQKYFYFSEENTKRLRISNATGVNAGVRFYIGSVYTDIFISGSKFDLLSAGHSAFALTTFEGGSVKSSNCTYVSNGGSSDAPFDEQPNGTIEIAYAADAIITFDNCDVAQLSGTVKFGYNHGTNPVGSNTPFQKSNWIQFPTTQVASSDPNTLDDYEEGTWIPILTASVSNPTIEYQVQTGVYTKIGRVVHCHLYVQFNAVSGGSGTIKLSLPYTTTVGLHNSFIPCITYNITHPLTALVAGFDETAATIYLMGIGSNSPWLEHTVADLKASATQAYSLNFSYVV